MLGRPGERTCEDRARSRDTQEDVVLRSIAGDHFQRPEEKEDCVAQDHFDSCDSWPAQVLSMTPTREKNARCAKTDTREVSLHLKGYPGYGRVTHRASGQQKG